MRAAPLWALAIATSACAHLRSDSSRLETVHVASGVIRVAYQPEDAQAARQVLKALPLAVAAAERWGTLSSPVLVTIHPSHQALESAAHREGNGWFLAWARHASVDLQSPRTWNGSDAEVQQILAHELTHCVMFQALRTRLSSRVRTIPAWFREGMASVSAGQEHKRVPTDAIWRFYRDNENAGADSARVARNPLADVDALWSSAPDFAYATAHEAFQLLLERYGEKRVRGLLASMGEGSRFNEAFRVVMGNDVRDFERVFRCHAVAKAKEGLRETLQLEGVAGLVGPSRSRLQ